MSTLLLIVLPAVAAFGLGVLITWLAMRSATAESGHESAAAWDERDRLLRHNSVLVTATAALHEELVLARAEESMRRESACRDLDDAAWENESFFINGGRRP